MSHCECQECERARGDISERRSLGLRRMPPPAYVAFTREVRRSVDGAVIASGSLEFIAAVGRWL